MLLCPLDTPLSSLQCASGLSPCAVLPLSGLLPGGGKAVACGCQQAGLARAIIASMSPVKGVVSSAGELRVWQGDIAVEAVPISGGIVSMAGLGGGRLAFADGVGGVRVGGMSQGGGGWQEGQGLAEGAGKEGVTSVVYLSRAKVLLWSAGTRIYSRRVHGDGAAGQKEEEGWECSRGLVTCMSADEAWGGRAFVGSSDGSICVCVLGEGGGSIKVLQEGAHKGYAVAGIAVEAGGGVVATAGGDGRIVVWGLVGGGEAAELNLLFSLRPGEGGQGGGLPRCVEWCGAGSMALCAGLECGRIAAWKLSDSIAFGTELGMQIAAAADMSPPSAAVMVCGHDGEVRCLAWDEEGGGMWSGGADGGVRLWGRDVFGVVGGDEEEGGFEDLMLEVPLG